MSNLTIALDPKRRNTQAVAFANALRRSIFGQERAVEEVAQIYQTFLAGLNPTGRPVGNLLFLGPTGSGKRRVVESMAQALFGDPRACIKIDCAEFQHSHEIAKLVGSPPGYVGHCETHRVLAQQAIDQRHTEDLMLGVKPHRSRNRSDRQREMQGVDSMSENMTSQQQSSKHLAARAVMAYRAGFPVALLSVTSSSEHSSGIVCDWKVQRDSVHDDAKLLARAFAFIYVGSIVDQAISDPISDELRKELVSDNLNALEARQTAVDWGVAEAVRDTNPFAHTGYKLASRLLRKDQPLIESLARELTSQGTIEGDALRKWLDANASPLNFDELETSITY